MRQNTLNLFVYGSLRKGMALHDLIAPSIVEDGGPVWTRGNLHYAPGARYPVLRPLADNVTLAGSYAEGRNGGEYVPQVKGDLFEVREDDNLRYAILMELQAGYNAEWLPVFDTDTGEKLDDALVFTWKWTDVGARIESGDYAAEAAAWR